MAETQSNKTQEQIQHLEWLTKFLSENFGTLNTIQEGLVEKGLIEFQHLPIIFEPGTLVVGQILQGEGEKALRRDISGKTESPECFLFHEIGDEKEDKTTGVKYMDVDVFRWGYNGSMFGLTAETLRIKEFPGPRKITDLECFPFKFLAEDEKNTLVPKLIARGKRWINNVEAKNFEYKGLPDQIAFQKPRTFNS